VISSDQKSIFFTPEIIKKIGYLDMMYRHSSVCGDIPIKCLYITEHDLLLTRSIVELGMYPCLNIMDLRPKGFEHIFALGDYMNIWGVDPHDIDWGGDYINDFLIGIGYDREDLENDEEDLDNDGDRLAYSDYSNDYYFPDNNDIILEPNNIEDDISDISDISDMMSSNWCC